MKAQQPHQDILKAAPDELDILLAGKIPPRRWKLKGLDLWVNANTNFRNIWSGTWDRFSMCSSKEPEAAQPKLKRQKVDDSRKEEKQNLAPIQVLLEDFCLNKAAPDEFLTFLMKRVKQGKGLPQLCCRKLKFLDMPLGHIQKILRMVQLDCVQEVEVNGHWDLLTLASFAPHLSQMVNLSRLRVSHVMTISFTPRAAEEVDKLLSQFSTQLLCLHQLHLDSVFLLEGHLDQVLRCPKTPLVTLSLTNCLLLESDLTHLASCLNTSHLRYLNLSEVNMMALSPEFLQVVLERASATLHRLALDGCGIRDSQLMSILPVLGRCSQLTSFSFRGNPVSVAALQSLLRHTVLLSRFRLGLFPVPLECYVGLQGTVDLGNLRQSLAELRLILQDLGRPNSVLLFSDSSCAYYVIIVKSCFLIGEDRLLYKGQGWNIKGAHSGPTWNPMFIGISFMGTSWRVPPARALRAAQNQLACGAASGALSPRNEVKGHRDVQQATSPGDELYNIIQTWPHYRE
ncbi:melanoma antigen preferentially expressed in tumors-like [Loxodonta africana]|uniref:melanoma antigen preferentially expressed in tumors-like n=1 Tax=Loxodonta africana TaxID=9785 RepID=UPI0030CD1394